MDSAGGGESTERYITGGSQFNDATGVDRFKTSVKMSLEFNPFNKA